MISDNDWPEVTEGEVIVVFKYEGKIYGNAFKLDDPNLTLKIKSKLEASKRVLHADS